MSDKIYGKGSCVGCGEELNTSSIEMLCVKCKVAKVQEALDQANTQTAEVAERGDMHVIELDDIITETIKKSTPITISMWVKSLNALHETEVAELNKALDKAVHVLSIAIECKLCKVNECTSPSNGTDICRKNLRDYLLPATAESSRKTP